MVAHGACFSVYQLCWVTKCEFGKCEMGNSRDYYISICLSLDENLLTILIHNSRRFSDIRRISTWRETP
jgi:hypothetical protein